jgi:hypothetical protein
VRSFDRNAIAARLRSLLTANREEIGAVAQRLCVDELSLRLSVDELSPHPTVEVLDAVIREYGVDPTWLLTGKYDSGSHRLAIEDGNIDAVLRDFIAARPSPISEPPTEHFRAYGQN